MKKLMILFVGLLLMAMNTMGQGGANDASFNVYDNGVNSGGVATYSSSLGITDIAVQADGKIIIVGYITSYNGVAVNKIARLNVDGTLDLSFNMGGIGFLPIFNASGVPQQILIQPDGKILMCLSAFSGPYNGVNTNNIARLNADGSLDMDFNASVLSNLSANGLDAIALQTDGKIIIAGAFQNYGLVSSPDIARLNSDGSADPTFNSGSGFNIFPSQNGIVQNIRLQTDGKIMVSLGGALSYNGTSVSGAFRLNATGTIDPTFNRDGITSLVRDMQQLASGKIMIKGNGEVFSINGITRNGLARLNADGGLDPGFILDPGIDNSFGYDFVELSNNKLILIGGFTNKIAQLNVDGSIDNNFNVGTGFDLIPLDLVLQQNNKLIVTGNFGNYNGIHRNKIARILTTSYDEPCTAGTLTASPSGELTCTNPILGDVALATNDGLITYIDPLPYHEYRNNDLWFKFVATHPTCLVRLDQDGDFRSAVNLYGSNDCNTVGSSIQSNVSYNSVFVTRYSGLITGNTYYLQVSNRDTATISTTFSICLLTGLPQDEICGAIDLPNSLPLSVNCSNEQSGDFNFATKSLTAGCNTQNDFWYKFTATHTTHVIKTSFVGNIAVYAASTCNGSLTQLYCNAGSFAENKFVPVKNLTVGSTYFVAIGVISLQNNLFTICQTAVENDEPCGAIPIVPCVPIQADAGFGTNTLNSTCQSHTAQQVIQGSTISYVFDDVQLKDLWYKFTAVSNRAELTLSGANLTGLFPLRITLRVVTFTDCNNLSGINIISDCVKLLSPYNVPLNNLTVGQEYYIAISNGEKNLENVLGTNFTMELRGATSSVSISAVPTGPVCSGAPVTFTATPTNGGDSPQYEWSVNDIVVGTANTYSTLSLQNGDVVSCKLTSSNCVTPLSISQSVTMQVFPTPVWYADTDGDGFGNLAPIVLACFQPNGYVSNSTDCDDTDATKNRTFTFYADNDGDGYGVDPGVQVCAAAAYPPPIGYGSASGDPDDNNANIYPGVIGQAEYFIDIDPGAGNGIAIPISNPLVNLNFAVTVPLNSLPTGFHFLSIRLKAYGEGWGQFASRGFLVTTAPVAYGGNILAAEYFIDSDPGAGSGNPLSVTAGDVVNQNTGIVIPNNLPVGFHSLSIRVKDAAGNWSLFERRAFRVQEAVDNVTPIVAAEFFLDHDPGAGNGFAIAVATDDTVIADLPLVMPVNTSVGAHLLAVRVKDANGKWSLFENRNIEVTPYVAWFRDADGDGFGNPAVILIQTLQPAGYVSNNTDCNDTNGNIYPNAPELCDGLDNDCDTQIDEGIDCFTRFAVTGGGTYCFGGTGVVVGLAGSNVGVIYQLKRGTINDGPALPGTGNPLSFGLRTITAYYSVLATKVSTSQQQTMLNTVKVARVSTALAPSKPGAITGPINVCPFLGPLNEATYSIRLAGNATSYVWVVPIHASIISGQGDSSIRVQFDSSFISGIISVQSINSCANRSSAFRTQTVAVPATTMQAISGPVDVCSFLPDVVNPAGIPVIYTVDFNVIAPLTISSYIWNVSPGITIVSGLNTNSITVLFSSNPNNDVRTISVSGFASDCINNKFATLNTNSNPPGNSLTGKSISTSNTNVCAVAGNIIYTLSGTAAPGNSLLWTVPTGATIISGQGSNSIEVSYSMQYFFSGFVTVRETNTCGIGTVVISRTISNPVIPSTPSPIIATTLSDCPNRTVQYTIGNAGNALGYVWSVSPNATILTGQNITSITVAYSAAASGPNDRISVYTYNNCRFSLSTRTFNVSLPACSPAFAGKDIIETSKEQPVVSTKKLVSEIFSTQVYPNPTRNIFNLKVITASKEKNNGEFDGCRGKADQSVYCTTQSNHHYGFRIKSRNIFAASEARKKQ